MAEGKANVPAWPALLRSVRGIDLEKRGSDRGLNRPKRESRQWLGEPRLWLWVRSKVLRAAPLSFQLARYLVSIIRDLLINEVDALPNSGDGGNNSTATVKEGYRSLRPRHVPAL